MANDSQIGLQLSFLMPEVKGHVMQFFNDHRGEFPKMVESVLSEELEYVEKAIHGEIRNKVRSSINRVVRDCIEHAVTSVLSEHREVIAESCREAARKSLEEVLGITREAPDAPEP